jgi:hypothetical protein
LLIDSLHDPAIPLPVCASEKWKEVTGIWQDTKSLQKSLAFLYNTNEQTKKDYMEAIPFTITSKKK